MRKYITLDDDMLDILEAFKTNHNFKTDNQAFNHILKNYFEYELNKKNNDNHTVIFNLDPYFEQIIISVYAILKNELRHNTLSVIESFIEINTLFEKNNIPKSINSFDDYCNLIIKNNQYDTESIQNFIDIAKYRHILNNTDIKSILKNSQIEIVEFYNENDSKTEKRQLIESVLGLNIHRTNHANIQQKTQILQRLQLNIKMNKNPDVHDLSELYQLVYE